MKKITKIITAAFILISFLSCSSIEDIQPDINGFEESVALIQKEGAFLSVMENEAPLYIEMINFNPEFHLEQSYNIMGVKFSDDGKFNDEIAGDGIYTSIELHSLDESKSSFKSDVLNIGGNFKYQNKLEDYLSSKYTMSSNKGGDIGLAALDSGPGIKVGCKVRLVQCPETSWWNTCWPLSSPCTCVEFYDCEVSVEVGIGR